MSLRYTASSGFYNYSRLIKNNTKYAKKINALSNEIFNEAVNATSISDRNLVTRHARQPLDTDPGIMHYYDYARHPQAMKLVAVLREHGLFRDEHMDFTEEMERLRELRGRSRKDYFERVRAKIQSRRGSK